MQVISAPRVVADGIPLGPGCVAVDQGAVVGVAAGPAYRGASPDLALPTGVLVPGLVDVQINGAYGVDLVSADQAGWAEVFPARPALAVAEGLPREPVLVVAHEHAFTAFEAGDEVLAIVDEDEVEELAAIFGHPVQVAGEPR